MIRNGGKTLTIFLVLILILLISSTSIGFFLYNKEAQLRKELKGQLDVSQASEAKLQGDLKEIKRQLAIAQDKNKEADDRINNLMDEIELSEGLKKQMKAENVSLKESLDALKKDRDQNKLDVDAAQKRYKESTELLKAEQDKSNLLQRSLKELEQAKTKAEAEVEQLKNSFKASTASFSDATPGAQPVAGLKEAKVELDKIVVNPNDGTRGRIVSVDKQAEFIVCNLGLKHGIKSGDVLSVFRGEEYLGDVKVSRVQEELSAADMIPPFSSRKVRKNDTVVFKP